MNVLALYFISDKQKAELKQKQMPIKKMSRTQRRKMKKMLKLGKRREENNNKMIVDSK